MYLVHTVCLFGWWVVHGFGGRTAGERLRLKTRPGSCAACGGSATEAGSPFRYLCGKCGKGRGGGTCTCAPHTARGLSSAPRGRRTVWGCLLRGVLAGTGRRLASCRSAPCRGSEPLPTATRRARPVPKKRKGVGAVCSHLCKEGGGGCCCSTALLFHTWCTAERTASAAAACWSNAGSKCGGGTCAPHTVRRVRSCTARGGGARRGSALRVRSWRGTGCWSLGMRRVVTRTRLPPDACLYSVHSWSRWASRGPVRQVRQRKG